MRQLGIVNMAGNTATTTPPTRRRRAATGERKRAILLLPRQHATGRDVIAAMAKAYEDTAGSLADRLTAALVAGDCAGGDHRGRLAAGIRVAKRGLDGYWLELYTDKSQDAVVDLLRKYAELQHDAKGAGAAASCLSSIPAPTGRCLVRPDFSRCRNAYPKRGSIHGRPIHERQRRHRRCFLVWFVRLDFGGLTLRRQGSTAGGLVGAGRRLFAAGLRLVPPDGGRSGGSPDIVQEVFASVVGSIQDYRGDSPRGSFRAWLTTITRRRISDHFRATLNQPAAEGGTEARARLLDVPEPALSPDGEELADESTLVWQRVVEVVRAEFEASTWQAFWRVAVDAVRPADAAQELGMSIPAVYKAKSRVLCRLRQALENLEQER